MFYNLDQNYHNFTGLIERVNKQGSAAGGGSVTLSTPLNVKDIENWHKRPDAQGSSHIAAFIIQQQKQGLMYITKLQNIHNNTHGGHRRVMDVIGELETRPFMERLLNIRDE